jgi:hypothetical protein
MYRAELAYRGLRDTDDGDPDLAPHVRELARLLRAMSESERAAGEAFARAAHRAAAR